MALSTVTSTVTSQNVDGKYTVRGTCAISASPATYTPGGIVMNLNQSNVKASRTPTGVTVTGQSGYVYSYVKGTDNSNGLLKIFAQTSGAAAGDPLAEIPTAAIPAAVSSDTIGFTAQYLGML